MIYMRDVIKAIDFNESIIPLATMLAKPHPQLTL
jgi:hypothetical protein